MGGLWFILQISTSSTNKAWRIDFLHFCRRLLCGLKQNDVMPFEVNTNWNPEQIHALVWPLGLEIYWTTSCCTSIMMPYTTSENRRKNSKNGVEVSCPVSDSLPNLPLHFLFSFLLKSLHKSHVPSRRSIRRYKAYFMMYEPYNKKDDVASLAWFGVFEGKHSHHRVQGHCATLNA